ncbi:hypothetical protein KAR34_06270, partial [bacterium]|nr:hypothetical protein [bacterium]
MKNKPWLDISKIKQWLNLSNIKPQLVRSKIIQWFDKSDAYGFLFRSVVVLAFLVMFILFTLGPCYDYGSVPEPEPRPVISMPAPPEPALPEP